MRIEDILHQHFFHEIGERTRSFLSGLSWVMRATVISRLLTGAASLYVGRRLGAAAFGDASVALALTFWIQIPTIMGVFMALMHYLPQSDKKNRSSWITTCLMLFSVSELVTVVVGLATRSYWARLWEVSPHMVVIAIAWCVGFQLYSASTLIFSATEDFQSRAFAEISFAILFPVVLLGFVCSHHLTAMHYVESLALAYGLSGLGGLAIILRRWPLSKFNVTYVRPLMTYGLMGIAGVLLNAMSNTPARLMAHRYLLSSEVGILSAYQAGSIQLGLSFLAAGSHVFFPIASRTPDPAKLLKKITRTFLKAVPYMLVLQLILLIVIFKILKKGGFAFQWDIALIFSLAAVTAFLQGILMWYMTSQGVRAMIYGYAVGLGAGIANIVLCAIFIKRWHVFGSGVAMTISSVVCIIGCYVMAPKQVRTIADPLPLSPL